MPSKPEPRTPGQLRARIKHLTNRIALLRKWRAHRKRQLAKATRPHGHQDWMPGVRHLARSPGTPWQVSCPPKGILHTTEGAGDATSTLDANRDWPHFQVEQDGRITQYLPLSIGARALVHSGDPSTNGAHAFQIEVCGFAAKPNWPAAQVKAVRDVMRFIEANGGVERASHVSFTNPRRLTGPQWLATGGWLGHVHVPENDHTDPGHIQIGELL